MPAILTWFSYLCNTRYITRSLFRSLLYAQIAILSSFYSAPAYSAATGVRGWNSGVAGYYPTAREACHAQWIWAGYGSSRSRFIGALDTNDWWIKECKWTQFQYLCPEETPGQAGGCGTAWPGNATFTCLSGYTRVGPGRCTADAAPERPSPSCPADPGEANQTFTDNGKANPAAGNPIVLGTGSKILFATDFASEDGRFRIGRKYRSFPAGYATSYRGQPLGLAKGWQFDFAMELQLGAFSGSPASPTGNVTLLAPDGSGYDFVLNSSGQFLPRAASGAVSFDYKVEFVGTLPATLSNIYNSLSEWRVTGPDDRVWTLTTFPRPNTSPQSYVVARTTRFVERDGYTWTYTYGADGALDTIADNFGRTATFVWNRFHVTALTGIAGSLPFPEAVSTITFPDGTSVKYSYDPAPAATPPSTSAIERLTGVALRNASLAVVDSTTYHYEDPDFSFALTGVTDHRAVRVATYQYDRLGRATSTEGASVTDKFTVVYGMSGAQATRDVTNGLGRTTKYRFDKLGTNPFEFRLAAVDGLASANCPASAKAYTYNADGHIASRTDEEGRLTNYTRDTRGRPTLITQAVGTPSQRQTSITWHSTLNVPTLIVEPGLSTAFVYTAGRLTSRTETDTTTHTQPYPTSGQVRTWTYAYNPAGLVSSIDGPLAGTGDTVSYTYDAAGYLATYTDEVANVTTVQAVNGRGQPTQIQDANGLVTQLAYDAVGRLTSTTSNPGGIAAQTLITYDNAGNVTKITEPNGAFLDYTYNDASRITKITDNFGQTANYVYDAVGNVTSEEKKNETNVLFFKRTQTFDELGRLLKIIGTGAASWTHAYDKVGNLTSLKDPSNNSATIAYDGLNRLITFPDERSMATATGYGPSGMPATVTDPHSVVTSYVRNGWGEVIREQSLDIGATVYVRDARGLVTQRTDARSKVTQYTYDNAGRLKTVVYVGETASDVGYTYDSIAGGNPGKGRLTGVTDAAGTVAYLYDVLGRTTRETRVIGARTYVVSYEWDKSGRPTKITYPSGRVVEIGRQANGETGSVVTRVTAAGPLVGLAWWVGRTPFGPRPGLGFGNDLTDFRNFDEDGRIISLRLTYDPLSQTLINRAFGYADNRNLTAINDLLNAANNESYWYTPNGFLQNADGPWGQLIYYIDGVGNITHRINTVGATTTTDAYGIPFDSNRLANVTTNGTLSRTFASDLAGNITQDVTVSPAQTKNFTYNSAGQLATALLGATPRGAYVYDYLSRLVSRTNHTVPATSHYVHDLDGNVIAEYSSAGVLQREYVWLDERPLAVVADAGTATPKLYFVHTDHLERPVMMTDASRAIVWQAKYLPFGEVQSITGTAALDQRFPGQWFQLESGLHYNWHRHYDPSTGRYMQPDPLGMPDGPWRWAYVANSPLMYVDPEGLHSANDLLWTPVPLWPSLFLPAHPLGAGPSGGLQTSPAVPAIKYCPVPVDDLDDFCEKDRRKARERCLELYENGQNYKKRLFGPNPHSIPMCMMGYMAEICGGNPIDWGGRRKSR